MQHLEKSGLKDAILDFANSKKPLLGICLGMQLLFESSEEFGYTKGLGLIEGKVVKFDKSKMSSDLKIPHMGWNKLNIIKIVVIIDIKANIVNNNFVIFSTIYILFLLNIILLFIFFSFYLYKWNEALSRLRMLLP